MSRFKFLFGILKLFLHIMTQRLRKRFKFLFGILKRDFETTELRNITMFKFLFGILKPQKNPNKIKVSGSIFSKNCVKLPVIILIIFSKKSSKTKNFVLKLFL